MNAIINKLFNSEDKKVILSTFYNDYTVKDIINQVDYYIDKLNSKHLKQKRIALIVPDIYEFVALVLAANKLGAIVIPISWQLRKDDLKTILDHLDPHIFFTIKQFNGFTFGEEILEWAKDRKAETIIYEGDSNEDWKETLIKGSMKPLETSNIELICCSSGSTGVPKGMIYSPGILETAYRTLPDYMDLKETDNVILNAPPTGFYGITALFYGIYSGSTVIYPESFDLIKMIDLMNKKRCNKVISTPSIFKTIYQVAKEVNPNVVRRLQLVHLSGEVITSEYMKQFVLMEDCKFVGMYGSSEGGAMGYCDLREKVVFTIPEDNKYKIVDGELLIRTPTSFIEYYNNSDLNEKTLSQEGLIYMGDIVKEVEKGKIEIVGRKKDMIKKGGQQVLPGEIEQLLNNNVAVKQSVVLGAPHSIYGEQVVAFIVPEKDVNFKELTYYCAQHIAGYKVPDRIITVDAFPLTNGKVDKMTLRSAYLENVQKV
ncbi:class I adenylate-forming enzyme family protein [Terribacillus sp. JSM ZJ617]|uniref:class I adenylate-forming enzyme family protein n=1 Tax=Terribacillus sp. JSM ZJ617 TaxID=3342119 RepID=UPI0035A95E12